jgi:hypothetical protein
VIRALLALALALVSAAPVVAASEGLEYAPPAPPAPPDVGGLVLRLVALTTALLAVCGGVLWFARRAARPVNLKGDGGGRLRHAAALALDRRSAVHLVNVDGQTVAVTTDATGLRALVLLSEPFEKELEAAESRQGEGEMGRQGE